MLMPHSVSGPLYTETIFKDVKDPCVIYDGKIWHLYGSGGDVENEVWRILHAVADSIDGPWKELGVVTLHGVNGDHVAAPSVHFEQKDNTFHMLVQTEFITIGGTIEYLKSDDGHVFTKINTALESIENSSEAGIYDPHQAEIDGQKYLVYAGTYAIEGAHGQYVIQPDVHLAVCQRDPDDVSWEGPWGRIGIILDHDNVSWHHNIKSQIEYEWGIEGPQIIQLPNGKYLLNATCFLGQGNFGCRQRVFFAIADEIHGPYASLGPVLNPDNYPDQEWQSGENGHATVVVQEDALYLFFQARSKLNPHVLQNNWRYGVATFALEDIYNMSLDSNGRIKM